MATPQLTKHSLPGRLGPILVDVRAGPHDEPRPAVLILHGFKGFKDWGMFPPFAERLARAGFTAVSFNVSGSGVDDAGDGSWPERFGRNTSPHSTLGRSASRGRPPWVWWDTAGGEASAFSRRAGRLASPPW
jgi:hypothetical protein